MDVDFVLADVIGKKVSPRSFDGIGELGGGVSCEFVGEGAAPPTRRDRSDGEDGGKGFGVDALFGGGEDGDLIVEKSASETGSGDGFAQTGLSFIARVFLVEVGDFFGDDVFLGADARGLLKSKSAVGIAAQDGDAGGDGAKDALGEGERVSALGFAEDEAQKLDAIADISKGLVMEALESDGFAKEAASVVFAAAAEFEISEQDVATDLREDAVILLDIGLVGDIKGFQGPETGASEIAVGEVDQGEVPATSGESGKITEFVVEAEELTCDADGVGKVAVVAIDADQVLKGGFA